MILEQFPEVLLLSASEKLIFVSELWNEIEAHPPAEPVSQDVVAELERRMDLFRQNPEAATTWEKATSRILGRTE